MKTQKSKMDELLTILDEGKELNLNLQDALTKAAGARDTEFGHTKGGDVK